MEIFGKNKLQKEETQVYTFLVIHDSKCVKSALKSVYMASKFHLQLVVPPPVFNFLS